MKGLFLVCSKWLPDGTGSAARHHYDWQADYQQRARDRYSVSDVTFESLCCSLPFLVCSLDHRIGRCGS